MNMSSLQPTMTLKLNSNFDELRCVIEIRRYLDEELEVDSEIPLCIFNVPSTLMSSDPDSYTPHQVAIGPYHYLRPKLNEMETYKLDAAKRFQKQLQCLELQNFVDQLTKHVPMIRACYHKNLGFKDETLAWMMAIDASFLLEFLQIYPDKEGKVLSRVSSRMSHLSSFKTAHNIILRDMVMLENQIPLFILRKMLEFKFSSRELADDMLLSMLRELYNVLSLFKMTAENLPTIQRAHLLDFLYHMIVPKSEAPSEIVVEVDHDQEEATQETERSFGNSSDVKQLLHDIWKGPVSFLKRLIMPKPVKVILNLPWTTISNLPGFSILKQRVKYFFFPQDKEEIKPENESSSSNNKPPLVEEITIPSVTELSKSGVRFSPNKGSISTISFDKRNITFYLPTISLDGNTEVILRNLVAYEESNASGPLVFTRYTELMNGIIDTEEDAKLLRKKGIILNRLKSDQEVAKVWNGMSKSIRLTKVPFLDKVIEDVNKYYNGTWKVKAGKLMKRYVFRSWQFLTLLAAILGLLLMTLQAFCSVYSCSRIFHVLNAQWLLVGCVSFVIVSNGLVLHSISEKNSLCAD